MLRSLRSLWLRLSALLSAVMGHVVLTAVYVVVIGIYAIVVRTSRFLKKKTHPISYWQLKAYRAPSKEELLRQF